MVSGVIRVQTAGHEKGAWPSGHALQTIISYSNEGRAYQITPVFRRTPELLFSPLESGCMVSNKRLEGQRSFITTYLTRLGKDPTHIYHEMDPVALHANSTNARIVT